MEHHAEHRDTYDVVVVGSGAAAFATALGAIDEGLSVIMVESTDQWGGNSSMSGGGMWLPNNPLMRREKVADSRDEALAYMRAVIGDEGPSASPERMEAFLDGVDDFVLTAEHHGMEFLRDPDYPDYYPEVPGGRIGRTLEAANVDLRPNGDWTKTQRGVMPLPVRTDDVWLLGRAWSTPGGFMRGARFVFRTIAGLARGKQLTGLGGALMAQFARAVLVDGGVPLLLGAPATGLVIEDGRVVGVRVSDAGDNEDGTPVNGEVRTLYARRGVMLAAGGFESNQEWRRRYQGIDGHTAGSPGNVGRPIEFAVDAGASTSHMEDAWWGAGLAPTDPAKPLPGFIVGERSMPFSIMVDAHGRRFANESESYVDLGHHMDAHDRGGAFWLITERRFDRRYFKTFSIMPGLLAAMAEQRLMHRSRTLEELALRIGVDPVVLRETVERFNAMARSGRDQDFGRGDSAYDRYYGDPVWRPNPNLGPLEHGPFTAYRIVLADLGTSGGLVTDERARVLRQDGSAIPGLYAAGNTTATVMGRTYPGAGATIGPAVVFGMIAARDMGQAR